MKFKSRLDKLEGVKCETLDPFVVQFRVLEPKSDVRVTGANVELNPPKCISIIGAGPNGAGSQLNCRDDETEVDFEERTRAEILRVHGRLPKDWE